MNKDTCMVSVARFFMQFTQSESCGKCVLCREGTKQMRALLDDIIEGRATKNTLEILEDLAIAVQKGSLCGLGRQHPTRCFQLWVNFARSTRPMSNISIVLQVNARPRKSFPSMRSYSKGCTACAKDARSVRLRVRKERAHRIDQMLCTKCGTCFEYCKFEAIKGR